MFFVPFTGWALGVSKSLFELSSTSVSLFVVCDSLSQVHLFLFIQKLAEHGLPLGSTLSIYNVVTYFYICSRLQNHLNFM